MKNTNTINNANNHNINRIAEATLKKVIFAAAKESEPSAKQIAKDKKKCEAESKRSGWKTVITYPLWDWYKKLMDNLRIFNEYKTGKGRSRIDIVESIFRLTEVEENLLSDGLKRYDSRYEECIKLINNANLRNEFDTWRAARQVYDRNGHVIRVGDIIRFPNITEVCGSRIENGYEAKVEMTDEGLVWAPRKILCKSPSNQTVARITGRAEDFLVFAPAPKDERVMHACVNNAGIFRVFL